MYIYILVSLGLNKEKPKEGTLEVYKESFEEEFLSQTEVFYTAESTQFIAMNTVADYMKKVETRLQEELTRVRSYLHQSTENEVYILIYSPEYTLFEYSRNTFPIALQTNYWV